MEGYDSTAIEVTAGLLTLGLFQCRILEGPAMNNSSGLRMHLNKYNSFTCLISFQKVKMSFTCPVLTHQFNRMKRTGEVAMSEY